MEQIFEWDEEKAQKNLCKHSISFEDATLVFDDPLALSRQDRIVNGELRWKIIGMAGSCTLIVVAYTERDETDGTEIIRIISARLAEPKERRDYERGTL